MTLSEEQIRDRGIEVAPAAEGTAISEITAPATARFDRDRVTLIGPRLPAKVVKVIKQLGDSVGAGDAVAVLDSVELGKAKASYLTARAQRDLARKNYEREKRLVSQKISSTAELQQARARFEQAKAKFDSLTEELRLYGLTREQIAGIEAGSDQLLSRYPLTTPQNGILEKRDITPGQTLTSDMTPVKVVDPTRMWIMIDLFERDIQHVAPGQKVTFTPRALSDKQFSGTVDWVAHELAPDTKTLTARASVSNSDGVLRAGMFGTAKIKVAGAKTAVIPTDAVQTVSGQRIVFTPVPGQRRQFAVAPVRTGQESGNRIEITAGLSPGDRLVVRGAFALMSILTAGSRQDTD